MSKLKLTVVDTGRSSGAGLPDSSELRDLL